MWPCTAANEPRTQLNGRLCDSEARRLSSNDCQWKDNRSAEQPAIRAADNISIPIFILILILIVILIFITILIPILILIFIVSRAQGLLPPPSSASQWFPSQVPTIAALNSLTVSAS